MIPDLPDNKNTVSVPAENTPDAVKTRGKKDLLIKIAAILLGLAVVGLIVYTLLPGRQAEKAVEKFMTALSENDPKSLEGLFSPATLEYGRYDKDAEEELFKKGLDSLRAPLVAKFGTQFKMTWKIIHEDPVSREDLIKVNSVLEGSGIDPIAEEKYLIVELKIEGNGETGTEEMRFLTSREGKHWYIVSFAH